MANKDFGDILAAFEKMEKENKTQKKSTGQEWRNKKTEPVVKTAERTAESQQKNAKVLQKQAEKPKIDIMTLALRRYGVFDKDAENQKKEEEQQRQDINYIRSMPYEAQIDLHGLTQEEAYEKLNIFVSECVKRRYKKLLIIHGKGNHSSTEPVLSGLVRHFIERDYRLGTSGHPGKEDGGKGATWVIVK